MCLALPEVWSQVVAYVIISVSRQLTYSIVFALTSALFGQEHLGKLLASNNAVVFTFGLLQYPLAQLVGSSMFPSWSAIDMFMTALALPLLLSWWLVSHGWRWLCQRLCMFSGENRLGAWSALPHARVT